LQHTYYSVISPEGCAGILWKHVKYADLAARALKFTSKDLLRLNVIDEIVTEPLGGAHRNHRQTAATLKAFLNRSLKDLVAIPKDQLVNRRYDKFRKIGVFEERAVAGPADARMDGAGPDAIDPGVIEPDVGPEPV